MTHERMRKSRRRASPDEVELARRAIGSNTQIQLSRGFSAGQLQYTIPIQVGAPAEEFHLQLDTGSSDLWLASKDCRSSSCRPNSGAGVDLYDDGGATKTNKEFDITYLAGTAKGDIVTSNIEVGGTSFAQAFAAATDVESQQLGSMGASGVLGLALPANSIIQATLKGSPAAANDSFPSSSATGSILPGVWQDAAAGTRFFSIGLQRLPSDGGNGNSTLTFGGYDAAYAPDASQIKWGSNVADTDGVNRKWTSLVTQLITTVNGTSTALPNYTALKAIWDTGARFNYGRRDILNAMYGAYGLGPNADQSGYYFPCRTLLQITLSINGELATIHPLDSTLKQTDPTSSSSSGCIGGFQPFVDDANAPADLVLGAPAMRSIYSAFSCDGVLNGAPQGAAAPNCDRPQIGVLGLLNDPASRNEAIDQFNQVRVQGKSLGDDSIIDNDGAGGTASRGLGSGAKIAIGVVLGVVGLLVVVAGAVLYVKRRRAARNGEYDSPGQGLDGAAEKEEALDGGRRAQKSAKEQAAAREWALLHGQFPEDEPQGEQPDLAARTTAAPTWDTDSRGYWEARAVKNEYKQKARAPARGDASSSGASGAGKEHEISGQRASQHKHSASAFTAHPESYEMSDTGSHRLGPLSHDATHSPF
ncbi:acid protease [Ceraceosorus guamensis]|uniref:Acid protease n=1 Tax=Ceraceosorus guamensis TaxID=1522189 RepID=A0A316WBZ0_9BASI|nr:acid protease [Ceraceosorus guamensis]PWN45423.1 acid protease [Ceraceosorus guamensis]